MAFGLTEGFEGLLSELVDLLPPVFHGHYQKPGRSYFLKAYSEEYQGTFWKMKLVDRMKVKSVNKSASDNIIRLNESHTDELEKMYESAYPDGYFERRMLHSGKFFGYLHDGQIVSCAGVHVDSEEYNAAVLGSIATLPEFRGKGLATLVTARVLKELISKRDTIMLNVNGENTAAVKCYANLGFEKSHEYEEGLFSIKK